MSRPFHEQYHLDRESFEHLGQWRTGSNLVTQRPVTIKICVKENAVEIAKEAEMYQSLAGMRGVPLVEWTGIHEQYCVIVLCGASVSLQDLRDLHTGQILGISDLEAEVYHILSGIHQTGHNFDIISPTTIRFNENAKVFVVAEIDRTAVGGVQTTAALMEHVSRGEQFHPDPKVTLQSLLDRSLSPFSPLRRMHRDISRLFGGREEDFSPIEVLISLMEIQDQRLELSPVDRRAREEFTSTTLTTAWQYLTHHDQVPDEVTLKFDNLMQRSWHFIGTHIELAQMAAVAEMRHITNVLREITPCHRWTHLSASLCWIMARLTAARSPAEQKQWLRHGWDCYELDLWREPSSGRLMADKAEMGGSENLEEESSQHILTKDRWMPENVDTESMTGKIHAEPMTGKIYMKWRNFLDWTGISMCLGISTYGSEESECLLRKDIN